MEKPASEAQPNDRNEATKNTAWWTTHYRTEALIWALLTVACALMLLVSLTVDPLDIESGKVVLSPPCPSRLLFHRDCPTCGLSRAFCAISHGNWKLAMWYNRASAIVYPATWILMALSAAATVRTYQKAMKGPVAERRQHE